MILLAIDPGNETSGVILMKEDGRILEAYSKYENEELVLALREGIFKADHVAIEMIASYGMAVGSDIFETCVFIGRIIEASQFPFSLIYRKDVKLCLCYSLKAKDSNIRRAILDLYPKTGGGKVPEVGIKSNPGELFGVSSHAWAALAVGLTWLKNNNKELKVKEPRLKVVPKIKKKA